jgi:hypothetical protein
MSLDSHRLDRLSNAVVTATFQTSLVDSTLLSFPAEPETHNVNPSYELTHTLPSAYRRIAVHRLRARASKMKYLKLKLFHFSNTGSPSVSERSRQRIRVGSLRLVSRAPNGIATIRNR